LGRQFERQVIPFQSLGPHPSKIYTLCYPVIEQGLQYGLYWSYEIDRSIQALAEYPAHFLPM